MGIPHIVGGSLASSVYGIPRATQDVDLVADINLSHVETFTDALTEEFYVDADMIRDAIQRRASFQVKASRVRELRRCAPVLRNDD